VLGFSSNTISMKTCWMDSAWGMPAELLQLPPQLDIPTFIKISKRHWSMQLSPSSRVFILTK